MKQVSIEQVSQDLPGYLQVAEQEYIVITREGVAIGILIGLEDSEDWWEELLLQNPQFLKRIEKARRSLREGKGISLEEMRKKYEL
ncbi:MAG: prevent-host-death protein [Coleofasciculus sp. C1-SOL-03]|jgi:PHD/YefM family antitoxin component YafN of YafNO toxin-antitoxin module|uniref:prevent-host-death protein n=1 Tax=Coleofasciculus sp. C1-SOL-03 TaxID=3069522 RepID=UPI0033019832